MDFLRTASTVAISTLTLQHLPALTSVAAARRGLFPALSGISDNHHIALTYDDGPDPRSTPYFLELLNDFDVRATFFLLGSHVAAHPRLVQEMSARGHEMAVHGWDHRCLATKRPGILTAELAQTKMQIEDLTGEPVRWYRPPYGVMTTEGILAARHNALRTILWSAWGRDWSRRVTPASIVGHVNRVLRPGGTLLLHDTDRTSGPGSWRNSLAASATLLRQWQLQQGTSVGPLKEHCLRRTPLDPAPTTSCGGPLEGSVSVALKPRLSHDCAASP